MEGWTIMKRITAIILSVLCIVALTSCGNSGAKGKNKEDGQGEGFSSASLVIRYDGKNYGVNEKVDDLKTALGEPTNTINQLSCHYGENGDEYWFDYYFGSGEFDPDSEDYTDVLRVHTVPLNPGEDYICDVECHTDKVTTDKNITVGSTFDDIAKAYGDGYEDEGDGFYTYYDGEVLPETPRLTFHLIDNEVEYFSVSAAINF